MKKTVNNIFIPKISGKKTVLRLLRKSDLKKSLNWLKDSAVNMYLSHNFRDYTEEQESKWFDFVKSSNNDIVFAIEDKKNTAYIGNCALHKIQWDKRDCELGIFIGEKEYWDKGYGSDAIINISKFAFHKLDLETIKLDVYSYNHRAIKVYQNCGFCLTKTEKKNHFYNGRYWDTLLMELRKN